MKHSHSHIPFLVWAVAAVLLVGAANAYMWHEVGASTARAIDMEDRVASAQADKANEQAVEALYQSTADDRAKLEGYFIPAGQVVAFIEALEALGSQAGSQVSLSAIGADDLSAAAPGTLGTAHAHVSADGSWPAVMRTLSLAEVLPYKVSISHVELDVSSSGSGATAKRSWSLAFDIQADIMAASSTTN